MEQGLRDSFPVFAIILPLSVAYVNTILKYCEKLYQIVKYSLEKMDKICYTNQSDVCSLLLQYGDQI